MNDDLISRSALKVIINEYIDEYSDLDNQGYHCEKWCAMKEAEKVIDNAPTVEDRPTVYVVPQECIKVLADTVADVIQKIDWNSLIKIVAEKETENDI